jgi:hypothetical protein
VDNLRQGAAVQKVCDHGFGSFQEKSDGVSPEHPAAIIRAERNCPTLALKVAPYAAAFWLRYRTDNRDIEPIWHICQAIEGEAEGPSKIDVPEVGRPNAAQPAVFDDRALFAQGVADRALLRSVALAAAHGMAPRRTCIPRTITSAGSCSASVGSVSLSSVHLQQPQPMRSS